MITSRSVWNPNYCDCLETMDFKNIYSG